MRIISCCYYYQTLIVECICCPSSLAEMQMLIDKDGTIDHLLTYTRQASFFNRTLTPAGQLISSRLVLATNARDGVLLPSKIKVVPQDSGPQPTAKACRKTRNVLNICNQYSTNRISSCLIQSKRLLPLQILHQRRRMWKDASQKRAQNGLHSLSQKDKNGINGLRQQILQPSVV